MTSGDPGFDPYKVLQVDPEAEDEVIEAAYRRLARKYHPDVAPGAEAQARMVALNRAWEMLSEPGRRAQVDRARAAAGRRDAWSSPPPKAPGTGGAGDGAAREPEWRARSGAGFAGGGAGTPPSSAPPRPGPDHAGPGTPPDQPEWPGRTSGTGFDAFADAVRGSTSEPRRPEQVSRDWSPGRSHGGGGYDASMRAPDGRGAAGPPPGRPSGSVLRFGRYDGWSLGEIARVDLEYLEWLERMPIGRGFTDEIDVLLRKAGRRRGVEPEKRDRRGLFRR